MSNREKPLTDAELKEIRKNLESDARVKWFWSNARVWVGYISAAIITAYATQDSFIKLFRKVFGAP